MNGHIWVNIVKLLLKRIVDDESIYIVPCRTCTALYFRAISQYWFD